MKKKIFRITLCVIGILGLLYLQFGRRAVINNVLTKTTPQGCELTMSITVNTLVVLNHEHVADSLIQKILENDFENIKMSYDIHGYPDEITVTVYANKFAKTLELPAFCLQYDVNSLERELFFGAK